MRYNKEELEVFKGIVTKKLSMAKEQAGDLRISINKSGENGTDDTSWSPKLFEDGAEALSKEELNMLYQKQYNKIQALEGALYRIGNKTYGICIRSGNLIPKERLMAMPEATTTIIK